MIDADALMHMFAQQVEALLNDKQRSLYAHVASYDRNTGSVRVIIPSMRDEFDTPVLSPWMQFGVPAAGAGGGVQYHPVTGATQDNPTAGEQCQVGFFDRRFGVTAAPCLHFGPNATPAALLPENDPLMPGETLIAQSGGSYLRIRADAGIDHNSVVSVRVGDLAAILEPLLNLTAMKWANAHEHSGVTPGSGTSGPPTTPMEEGTHTTTQLTAN